MPITNASLVGDLRLATILDAMIRVILHDSGSIRQVAGAVDFEGSVNGSGSDTSRLPFAGLDGYDTFTATGAEDTELTETPLHTTHVDIAVARVGMLRGLTDLANLTGPDGNIDPQRLANSMVDEFDRYYMQLIANTMAFSTTVGTAGKATMDDVYDAIFALELAYVPGPYYGVIAHRQAADIQEASRAEGGAYQFTTPAADILKIKGPGFFQNILGIDFWTSSKVNTSGGRRLGAVWGQSAMGYRTGTVKPAPGAIMVRPDSMIAIEFERRGTAALSRIIGHGYIGMSIKEDSRGATLSTSA